MRLAEPDSAELYFYGWRVGALTYLGAGEYRWTYDRNWPVAWSAELPLVDEGTSYEGRRMPAFFENRLPERMAESVVRELDDVLAGCGLADESTERYRRIVHANVADLGI